jgi:uncharacterized caspase-like protein
MPAENKRNGVALVIGVGDYVYPAVQRLDFAADDAAAVAELLADADVCGFPRERIQLLIDAAAARDAIVQHLSRWLPEQGRGADLAVVYFAGHGMVQTIGKKEEGFLLPVDGDPDNPAARGVAMHDVARWIEGIPASSPTTYCAASRARGTATATAGSASANCSSTSPTRWRGTLRSRG